MKKVGIITLCSNDNYGNKLQNYALKKIIEKYGFEVHTIWTASTSNSGVIKKFLKLNMKKIKKLKYFPLLKKEKNLKKFSNKYLNNDYSIRLSNDLTKVDKKYDYFVVGSDQVWNYKYMNDFDLFFLNKIDKEKCLSYAASFGISDIPKDYNNKYLSGLSHIKYLSVREDRGKELVREITNREDVDVHIDPTLLLTRQEWNEIEEKPKGDIPSKYILTYFLGKVNEQKQKEIFELSIKYNCSVINIMDIKSEFYSLNPGQFLYLVDNSLLVLTDSFHACVFSILYDKTFIVFDRDQKGINMSSRIDTLLLKLKINNRKYNNESITTQNLEHNYSEAYKILENEREKSKKYIAKILDIK